METESIPISLRSYAHLNWACSIRGQPRGPSLRMVFALASQESDVQFREVDETCDEFTASDIWCAGTVVLPQR
jgi:hypothetical protein